MAFKLVSRGEGPVRDRYRPRRLSEIVPTFSMKDARAILSDPNSSRVWLLEGLTGVGKTTLARIISRAYVCEAQDGEKPCLECHNCTSMERQPDFTEINVAEFGGKDAVKDKIANMHYVGSYLGGKKIYIFDEAHQLTPAAQELLNKVLEEPIKDTLIFLCTTHKKGLKRTLIGRCANINFKRMTRRQLIEVTKQVLADAGMAMVADDVVDDLFVKADGSVRDLTTHLDRILRGSYRVGFGSNEDDEDSGAEGAPNIFALVGGLKAKDWDAVRHILNTDNVKNDPDGYRETVCSFLAKDALKEGAVNMGIATALGHLAGSLCDEPRREQHSLFVLRAMRACYKKQER